MRAKVQQYQRDVPIRLRCRGPADSARMTNKLIPPPPDKTNKGKHIKTEKVIYYSGSFCERTLSGSAKRCPQPRQLAAYGNVKILSRKQHFFQASLRKPGFTLQPNSLARRDFPGSINVSGFDKHI